MKDYRNWPVNQAGQSSRSNVDVKSPLITQNVRIIYTNRV